ncbi:LptF/LptG family permease [Alphaproteobacteria bacterium]|nr:LptF/LptG family permease [Alphaproteobacteria bacterium]
MIGISRSYIIYNYFKYILIILLVFIGLIWLSQIIRIIEFQYSISNQILEIAGTTLLALPSFINPLVPFLILIGSFMLNSKIKNSNEIIILKQYLSYNKLRILFQLIIFLIFVIFALNNEIISKNFYEKYKIKELEIRNNLKLGTPAQKEFHIDDIVSIFFEKKIDNNFYDINAIIYEQNQFIVSNSVVIELSKSNFNLVFLDGERLILNDNEKSKTIFDKFTYVLESKKYEELYLDKDHYNTFELISHPEKEFRNHGHNKIFQYFFLIVVGLISLKIIFFYVNKLNNISHFGFIFFAILIAQILNSYLIYLLDNLDTFSIAYYYIFNFTFLIAIYISARKILK